MKVIGPRDATQLAALVRLLEGRVNPKDALGQVDIKDPFARQVAKAIAGKKNVTRAAKAAATQLTSRERPSSSPARIRPVFSADR